MADNSATDDISKLLGMLPVAQGVFGVGQKIFSEFQKKKAKDNFTPFEIPSAVNMMLDKANSLASQTEIPGADVYRSQARSNASQTIEQAQRTAGSSSDVMGTLPGVQGNLDKFYQDIAAKGAGFYQQNQAQQQRALETFGQYETERWKQNEYMPYIQALTNANITGQAGNQNIGSAIGSGMALGQAKWETEAMNKEMALWKLEHGLGGTSASGSAPTNSYQRTTADWWNNTKPQ